MSKNQSVTNTGPTQLDAQPGDRLYDDQEEGTLLVVDPDGPPAGEEFIEALQQTVAEYNGCDPETPTLKGVYVDQLEGSGIEWQADIDQTIQEIEAGEYNIRVYSFPANRFE